MNVLAYFRSIFMPVIGKLGSSKLWITFELSTEPIEFILFFVILYPHYAANGRLTNLL